MRRTCRVVDEQRPVRRERLLLLDPRTGMSREILVQRVVLLAARRCNHLNRLRAFGQLRMPLVSVGADEAIVVVVALMCWPVIIRARERRLRVGNQMPLAERRRRVAVLA